MRKGYSLLAILGLAGSAGLFTGCEDFQSMANRNRTATGAVTGAAIGAGSGALLDRHSPGAGALMGGAAGAAAGGLLGYGLDRERQDRINREGYDSHQQRPPSYSYDRE